MFNLADTAELGRQSETARSSQEGRQLCFSEALGLTVAPVEFTPVISYSLGSTSKWLRGFYGRLDFIRVAKPLASGSRLHYLEQVEDNTRRMIRQLGGNPWGDLARA